MPLRSEAAAGSHLETMLALELGESAGEPITTPVRAFELLSRGELEHAVQAAAKEPKLHPQVLRLAAASDGARPELIQAPSRQFARTSTRSKEIVLSIRISDKATGRVIGEVSEQDFEILSGHMEEESSKDQDYYVESTAIEADSQVPGRPRTHARPGNRCSVPIVGWVKSESTLPKFV